MTELKTLKDLDCGGVDFDEDNQDQGEIKFYRNLKAEAIKWVKSHHHSFMNELENCIQCNWIKHFFNLTEEDLK